MTLMETDQDEHNGSGQSIYDDQMKDRSYTEIPP